MEASAKAGIDGKLFGIVDVPTMEGSFQKYHYNCKHRNITQSDTKTVDMDEYKLKTLGKDTKVITWL